MERRLFLAVFLVAAALAAPLRGSSESRTLDLLHAMSRGRLSIDAEVAGNTFDRAVVPRPAPAAFAALGSSPPPAFTGHIYAGGAPGAAFLLFPFHELVRRFVSTRTLELLLLLAGSTLPLAAGSVAVKRAVERATSCAAPMAMAAGALHGLATIALPYGARLHNHSLSVALLAGSLALALRPRADRPALAGLLAALAVMTDFGAAIAASALLVLALGRGGARGGLAFAAGTLPAVLLLGSYHRACFGSPFVTAYDFRADPRTNAVLAHGLYGYALPSPKVFVELLLGGRGFLGTQPIALVGLAGLASEARRRPNAWAFATVLAVLLAHAARGIDWHGGWSHGPRYSISALPFLALGFPRGLGLLGRAAWPVAAASSFLAWVGATVEWTVVGSVAGNVREFFLLGPRTRALDGVLLGAGPSAVTTATSIVSSFALMTAFAAAAALLVPRARRLLVCVALAPWVASVPFHVRTFVVGPAGVQRAYRASYAGLVSSALDAAHEPAEARDLLSVASLIKDPGLLQRILDRVVDLDPADATSRAERDRLRAALRGSVPGTALAARLDERIAAVGSGVTVAVAFRDLETGEVVLRRAHERFHAASTMKLPIMMAVHDGHHALDEPILVENRFASIVDGSAFALDPKDDEDPWTFEQLGRTVPLGKLVERMIVRSSNLATNLVIERVGVACVASLCESLGAGEVRVLRGVEDQKAFDRGLNNETTAAGLATLLAAIGERRVAGADAMIEVLARQELNEGIPSGLPPGTRVAHKTGGITKIYHDAALVLPASRKGYVLVVLTRGFADEKEAARLVSELSRLVWTHVAGED
jgi:beta-lactamase class A